MAFPDGSKADGAHQVLIDQQRRQWNHSFLQAAAILVIAAVAGGFVGLFDVPRLAGGMSAIWQLSTEMVPPDFKNAGKWVEPVLDTLAMSVAGTALAVVFSVPLGLLAARNTTPNPVVYYVARTVLNMLRTIPELFMGVLFVAAVGFGPLPGVLALGFHSIGMVGKFFAEAVEHADPAPIEAVRAVGARPMQVIVHGILPQVLPKFADIAIYRWEYNFRASTVMGMVGAGGIGLELMTSLRLLNYQEVAAILLVVFAMVTLVDGTGAKIRKRFL